MKKSDIIQMILPIVVIAVAACMVFFSSGCKEEKLLDSFGPCQPYVAIAFVNGYNSETKGWSITGLVSSRFGCVCYLTIDGQILLDTKTYDNIYCIKYDKEVPHKGAVAPKL